MSFATNPFTNPPRLPSPSKRRTQSRSPLRLPARQHAPDSDPLLRDLSPTSTLRTFVQEPSDSHCSEQVSWNLQTSSTSQRALGAKAAQACLDLRQWTRELESWEWPGTFDVPEPKRKKMRMSAMTIDTIAGTDANGIDEEEEYWGSLPSRTVRTHEERVNEIGKRLDEINVEELKDYVLVSHYRVDSRPPSRDDSTGTRSTSSEMKALDDFIALITATILQALPYLSRLRRLLDIWFVRLSILRSAPGYLRDLRRARVDLDHGWAAIAVSPTSKSSSVHTSFDRTTMNEMKSLLEQKVARLGRCLDRFLDELEGRDDTVPDSWLDEFEQLESAYGDWVVQAERKMLDNECRSAAGSSQALVATSIHNREGNDGSLTRDNDQSARSISNSGNDKLRQQQSSGAEEENGSDSSTANAVDNAAKSIPLLVNEDGTEVASDGSFSGSASAPRSSGAEDDGTSQIAKRRAAFLNNIERTNSLKQSKSPVRPFEHASNAFTRLFKKDRSPEQKRVQKRTSSVGIPAAPTESRSTPSHRGSASPTPDFGDVDSKTSSDLLNDSPGRDARSQRSPQFKSRPAQGAAQPDGDESMSNTVDRGAGQDSSVKASADPSENWPLVDNDGSLPERPLLVNQLSQVSDSTTRDEDSGSELQTPKTTIDTDVFDRIFIESLPARPTTSADPTMMQEAPPPWTGSKRRTASLPRSKRANFASYLDMVGASPPRAAYSSAGQKRAGRSNSSSLPGRFRSGDGTRPALPELTALPDFRTPASPSGAQIQPSGVAPTSLGLAAGPSSTSPRKPSSSSSSEAHELPSAREDSPSPTKNALKRASVTSIGSFPRSELRSIDVQRVSRQNSTASRSSPTHSPRPASMPSSPSGLNRNDSNRSPMTYKGLVAFPTPPPQPSSASTPPSGRMTPTVLRRPEDISPAQNDLEESPSASSKAPLNDIMAKRRGGRKSRRQDKDEKSGSSLTPSSISKAVHLSSEGDSFDRHVSEVLETLPGQITFKARAGAETPLPRTAGYVGPARPKQSNMHAPPRTGSMTIAPAENTPQKSKSSSDQEVKLYHLTQVGREEPIKLFVRLVGEGERVMVRVGGGWADLAEYLRQYAEHHGSRTVSESALEVQTMPNVQTRKVSGPAERAKTPISPAVSSSRPGSSDSDKEWPARPPPSSRITNGRSTPTAQRVTNGRQTPNSTHGSTPQSTSTGSRPSTANLSRPSSRQQTLGEIGLSGPSSGKKNGLSEHKAKWVEGMIERTKQASSEKNKENSNKHFGELGKAGGTRRVIFRSGSGTGPQEKAKSGT